MINNIVKKIQLPENISFSFCAFNNKKLVLLTLNKSTTKYVVVPSFIICEKKDNTLILTCLDKSKLNLDIFIKTFLWCLKCLEKATRKKLFLKGLGYRINFSEDKKNLEFKIGFSHIIKLPIPLKNLSVTVDKNRITLEGINPVTVGNFAVKIKNLRKPDSYKGKGFWYKNENISLKEVKKK